MNKTLATLPAVLALPLTLSAAVAASAATPSTITTTATAVPEPTPSELVDALNNTFGRHAGMRASHAQGFCAAGTFTPSPAAKALVASPLFERGPLAAQLRFSIGGGNPKASDKSRSVRGMALRLDAPGERYDLVLISEPVFFAATPASFVSFLQARVADPATGKPDPQAIAAHNARHPDGTRQPALLAAHAAPASYASTPYFSNHAFVFRNGAGKAQHARLVVEPEGGTHYLSADDEKALPDRFLEDELKQRAAAGTARFIVTAQLPAAGDALLDPSMPWTGAGRVELGRLVVTTASADTACQQQVYLPASLPTGIALSDDPVLQSRGAAYGVSLGRRSTP